MAALPVYAQQTPPSSQSEQPQQLGSQSQPGSQTQPGSQPEVIAAAFTAEVTGQVQNVDQQSGMLTLQTVDGPVNDRVPAPAVQAIKPGDQVTVVFGLVKQPPSASPPTSPGSR